MKLIPEFNDTPQDGPMVKLRIGKAKHWPNTPEGRAAAQAFATKHFSKVQSKRLFK